MSGQTIPSGAVKGLDLWRPKLEPCKASCSKPDDGGNAPQHAENVSGLPWQNLGPLLREIRPLLP